MRRGPAVVARSRALALLTALSLVLIGLGRLPTSPAAAAGPGEQLIPTTTTTTSPGPTTTSRQATTTSTTEPAPATTTTTTPQVTLVPTTTTTTGPPTEQSTTTTLAPAPVVDAPVPVDDPDEAPPDESPAVRPVPPRTSPRQITQVDQAVGRVVTQQVRSAQDVAAKAIADATTADAKLAKLVQQQEALHKDYDTNYATQSRVTDRLKQMRANLKVRAIALYIQPTVAVPVGDDIYEFGRRRAYVDALHVADQAALANYQQAKQQAGSKLSKLVDQVEDVDGLVAQARAERDAATALADQARLVLDQLKASGAIAINGFVFPVGDPHNFASTFGAPRSGGRLHQGNDIFAPYGTPLFACERGIVDRVGTNTLGGIKLWIIGQSGTTYYYAHLSAYAEGIQDGLVVEAGDVVGYVGNTGNAISTPSHLHYEIHPNGGPAVDPYPILKTVDDTLRQLNATRPSVPTLPSAQPNAGRRRASAVTLPMGRQAGTAAVT